MSRYPQIIYFDYKSIMQYPLMLSKNVHFLSKLFFPGKEPSHTGRGPGGRFKNTYELFNLRALKISKLHKNYIFQCMGKIFCVEFQRVPLKFHTKDLTHTLKDVDFIHI